MKKYLLFDLDGTLTDPKEGITSCVQYALRSFGMEEPDLDKLEPFIGPPLKDSFMQFYGMEEAQAQAAVEKYRERFQDKGIFENKLYSGIPNMLRELKDKGMHLAVASSKPTVFVERILEHFHINQYFEVVVGSELDGTRVNKDEVISEALNGLFHYMPIKRDQVYMIGDRKFDVEGAKSHQVECVAVTYGYGSMEELKEAKADYIVQSVEELQKFLLRGTDELEKLAEGTKSSASGRRAWADSTAANGRSTGTDNRAGNGAPGSAGGRVVKGTPTQRIWAMALPFLMFLIVRSVFLNLEVALLQSLSTSFTGALADAIYVWNEEGTLIGFSGSAGTIMSALAFAAGAVAILPRAKLLLGKTAEDMKLAHLKREPLKNYGILAGAVVGAVLGFNLLFNLIGMVEQSASYQEAAAKQYASAFVIGLVCYGIITPLAEELLFRGILYGYLRRFQKLSLAILISAFLFGGYHMNMVQGMYGFLLGCLIAYGYEYFGDFKVALGIHVGANLIAYLLTYTGILGMKAVAWPVCIVALAVMAGCVVMLHKQKNIF